MSRLPDLADARHRLGRALEVLRHDRWVLGGLADGWLKPIAASPSSRQLMQSRPLTALARRALFDQRPLVVNSVQEDSEPGTGYDWELDWPALMYIPVGDLGCRPTGLLLLGCRQDYWYSEDDIDYAFALGATLAPLVAMISGPIGRLNPNEREVAQLLSQGLSAAEVAKAIRTNEYRAQTLVDNVVRKLGHAGAPALAIPVATAGRRGTRSSPGPRC